MKATIPVVIKKVQTLTLSLPLHASNTKLSTYHDFLFLTHIILNLHASSKDA